MKQLIWLLVLLCLGCNQNERVVQTSFYHWKQKFRVRRVEQTYINNMKIKSLYIRFFDINKSNDNSETTILSPVHFTNALAEEVTIVPTIYITNNTLKNVGKDQLPELADLIWENRQRIIATHQLTNVKGIQIDCDWSLSTRDKYFELLRLLKQKLNGEELSATIRLHQVKFYKKTGVPPVDRGTLMFYNMDDVTDAATQNSILDLEVAKQYFVNFDQYELPLDVALPLFSWGVVRRRGRVVQLINQLKKSDLTDIDRFEATENDAVFKVLESHYLKGFYLYKDDKIRIEQPSKADLTESVRLLNQYIRPSDTLNVTFYHLDSTTLSNYQIHDLKGWIQGFQ